MPSAASYYRGEGRSWRGCSPHPALLPVARQHDSSFLTTSWTWTPNSTLGKRSPLWLESLRSHRQRSRLPDPGHKLWHQYRRHRFQLAGPSVHLCYRAFRSGRRLQGTQSHVDREIDYDVVDHVSFLHGNHDFQFGGEILTLRAFFAELSNGRGNFAFNGGRNNP